MLTVLAAPSMHSSPRFVRWLVALVVMTSTPGLAELVEGVVHMAIDDHGDSHHETDTCADGCEERGCTQGLFHTCRCNASPLAPISVALMLPTPTESSIERIALTPAGQDQPAHRSPPFRPPSA